MKTLISAALLLGFALVTKAQPVITSPPTNLTVNAGSAAYFYVTANNATAYQWTNSQGKISGATNATYSFDNVATNQAGVYAVIVSSASGSVTNAATLTVLQGTVVNFLVSGFASGPTNIVVELFDHDKPATVENFVHYIRPANSVVAVYSNWFFDRLIPGFVLQSGDFVAADRTNTEPFFDTVYSIYNNFVDPNGLGLNPPLPYQVDNEYYVGPVVSNRAGTLSLALPAGNVNGGNSAFFFNLVDNPELDSAADGGPFTVFGRVIGGTSVLNYFNNTNFFFEPPVPANLVFTSNIFDDGLFNLVEIYTNTSDFNDLPVNFHGTNIPADSNLFFINFSFPDTQPVVDTTPPTAAITFPLPGEILTNGNDFTAQGTAHDNIGLALVYVTMYPLNGANNGLPVGADADGTNDTTSWWLDFGTESLQPGLYEMEVTPQDGAGNIGGSAVMDVTLSAVLTNGVGATTWTNLATGASNWVNIVTGATNTTAVGANLLAGTSYNLGAQPGSGQLFLNWSGPGLNSIKSAIGIVMSNGLALTATFVSNNLPAGSVTMTNPAANAVITNDGAFSIQGALKNVTSAQVTCQLYAFSTGKSVGPALQATGTTQWSVSATNLAAGQYIAQALARDSEGRTTVITNDFTLVFVPSPTLSGIKLSGTNLALTGANGQSGATYYVLMSTNLLLPPSQWTPVATNILTASGNFTITATNAVSANAPQRFYLLQTP
jgi:cyclophilin family peptidyl-prolyl cis-trans isomerase